MPVQFECRLVEHMKEEDITSAVIVVKNKISGYAKQVEFAGDRES